MGQAIPPCLCPDCPWPQLKVAVLQRTGFAGGCAVAAKSTLATLEVDFRISLQNADDAGRAYRRTVTAARAGVLKQGFCKSPWRTLERNARADATPQEITATDHREILDPTAGQTSYQLIDRRRKMPQASIHPPACGNKALA